MSSEKKINGFKLWCPDGKETDVLSSIHCQQTFSRHVKTSRNFKLSLSRNDFFVRIRIIYISISVNPISPHILWRFWNISFKKIQLAFLQEKIWISKQRKASTTLRYDQRCYWGKFILKIWSICWHQICKVLYFKSPIFSLSGTTCLSCCMCPTCRWIRFELRHVAKQFGTFFVSV